MPTSMPSGRIPYALRRVFVEAFTAHDIAEPLASFDDGAPSADVRAFMEANDFDVVGIRRDGRVAGFVGRESLDGGACGGHCVSLDGVPVLDDASPLLNVLLELKQAPLVFISLLGAVGGIVTRDDLEKPPVRMWLFGLVTLIESRFTELIERHCTADKWMQYLSEARLEKARAILSERRRRNQSLRLFDCLQFADKGQIVARDAQIRQMTIFPSRRAAEDAIKTLERLRNNLAHAQDVVTSDWDAIVRLGEFVSDQFKPIQ